MSLTSSSPRVGNRIRQLQAGEPIPNGRPRRYLNSTGYVRLRWKIGFKSYVEAYEHRVVAGAVGQAVHVHHRNHDKANNDATNLQVLAPTEHAQIHQRPSWDVNEAMRLYQNGWATTKLATRYGLNSVTVFRALRRRGCVFDRAEKKRIKVSVSDIVRLHNEGENFSAIGRALGVSRDIVKFRLRDHHHGGPSGAHAPTKERMKNYADGSTEKD